MNLKYIYILSIIIILFLWQYFGETSNSVRLFISNPKEIISFFESNWLDLLDATWITFFEAVMGLVIAIFISFITMIICIYFPNFLNFIMPIMITSQIIPVIVLAPFFMLLFGIGVSSKIAMAALISFFPIFINFATGLKSIPKEIEDFCYLNNTKTLSKIRYVYIPLSLPNIFAGLKIASTLSVIGAIVAEFTGAKIGIGKNLFVSSIRLEPELMMSSLILSTIMGFTIFGIVIYLEKITTKLN